MQRKLEALVDPDDTLIRVHLLVTNDDATQALSFAMYCTQEEFGSDNYYSKFSSERHEHATIHTASDYHDCECDYVKEGFCQWWEDRTFAAQMAKEMCVVGSEIVFEHMEKYLKEES